MKTNKLPESEWSDSWAAGSQSQQPIQPNSYKGNRHAQQTKNASNDASYSHNKLSHETLKSEYSPHLAEAMPSQDSYFGYKSAGKRGTKAKESTMNNAKASQDVESHHKDKFETANGYERPVMLNQNEPLVSKLVDDQVSNIQDSSQATDIACDHIDSSYKEIPERVFMNGLIKHTGIALAIIIPLAAFSAYAATPPNNMTAANTKQQVSTTQANTANDKTTTEMLSVKPSDIIYKSTSSPTTADSVDLNEYAGTWYEIGRLPMYFQKQCAGDVTANYTQKSDGSGIIVTNKCMAEDGSTITADGLAKPADESGSKLKVTFLPKWIRWIPVGRADYWVLARDADYKTALVGTPDKEYLWLLARSPNISQQTYAKYRQIAQQQGYDLKEFKLTSQTNQSVNLVP